MDKTEAREILKDEAWALQQLTYEQLRSYYKMPRTFARKGASGVTYQIEEQSFVDDTHGKNLRVVISIDDGGMSAFKPMTRDFIVSSDDSHLGGEPSGI